MWFLLVLCIIYLVFHVLFELDLDFRLVYSRFSHSGSWGGRNRLRLPFLSHFPSGILFGRFLRLGSLVKAISPLLFYLVKPQRKDQIRWHPRSPLSVYKPWWVLLAFILVSINQIRKICSEPPRVGILFTINRFERPLHWDRCFAPPFSLNGSVDFILGHCIRDMGRKAWLVLGCLVEDH